MAKKKIYAVKKGFQTGLFHTWDQCKKAVDGYSGAEFKSFTDKEEAMDYLGLKKQEKIQVPDNMVIAYVDGSFEKSINKYSYGCILLTPDGKEIRKSGSGDDPACAAIRNVAGEMLGAMNAVKWAKENGYPRIEIRYDYQGVEKWVTGAWRTKNELTSKYAQYMQRAGQTIHISFCKVAAHTGDFYNEQADKLAKEALYQ